MPFVLDTNVWIDAAQECEVLRDRDRREICEIRKKEALDAIDVARDDCFIPIEVKKEISPEKNYRVYARSRDLMKRAGCKPLSGDPEKAFLFERACALESKKDRNFLQKCTSRMSPEKARSDWKIVAKTAELSEKLSDEVYLVSRDSNLTNKYCIKKYEEIAEEYFNNPKFRIISPDRIREVVKFGVPNELVA